MSRSDRVAAIPKRKQPANPYRKALGSKAPYNGLKEVKGQ